jgi:hypothetical protein
MADEAPSEIDSRKADLGQMKEFLIICVRACQFLIRETVQALGFTVLCMSPGWGGTRVVFNTADKGDAEELKKQAA